MLKKCLLALKGWIIFYIVIGILIRFLSNLNILFYQKLIDQLTRLSPYQEILKNAVTYGIILGAVCILNYINEYPGTFLENSVLERLKLYALQKIARIDYSSYQKLGTGEIIKVIENGAAAGQAIVFSFYLRIFSELLPTILFSLIFISFFNVKIMSIIAIGYIVIFFVTNLILRTLYELKNSLLKKQEGISKYSVRGFMELVVFRVNKRYKKEFEKINSISNDIVKGNCRITMVHEAFFFLFAMLIVAIKIVVIMIGVNQIIAGQTTIGILVALLTFIDNIYSPIAIFNVLYIDYRLNKVAYNRLLTFVNEPEDKNLYYGNSVNIVKGNITFEDVSFQYQKVSVLKSASFQIKEGSSVALVGESGGGKTTVLKLLMGLIKKDNGKILIDGKEIDTLMLDSLYDHISYISQDSPIFDASIRENIIFDSNISDEEIYKVLQMVNLEEQIKRLPQELDTIVGEKGMLLSGGEKQRIAVARAILQNRKIIIMDEPVSALDNINEEIIMRQLLERFRDRVIVIVAHRLNYIQNVDQILVVKEGEIIAEGTFNELIHSCNYFNEIWNKNTKEKTEM